MLYAFLNRYAISGKSELDKWKGANANMDEMFSKFECWYLNKKTEWEQAGVFVDKAGLGQYGHQYWIELHSENGLGNIVLYESNNMYWVDFEGGNYNYDVMFLRAGIEFDDVSELDSYEKDFIKHITWYGADN